MFIWSFRVQVCFPLPPATWVSSKRHNCLVTAAMIKLWMMKHVADYEDVCVKNSLKIDFPQLWWYEFNMDDGIMDIKATWSSESWNRSFRLHTWAQSNAPRHRVHSMDLMSEHCPRHTVYVIIHDHLMEQTMWTTRRAGQPFLALTWWTPHHISNQCCHLCSIPLSFNFSALVATEEFLAIER